MKLILGNSLEKLKELELKSAIEFSNTEEERLENRIQYLEGKIEGLEGVVKVLKDMLDKR